MLLYLLVMPKRLSTRDSVITRLAVFLYKHVFISATFWIALFVFGVLSYTVFMQRQGFPSVNVPISTVNAVYLVNDKAQVDKAVAQPILEAVKSVEGVVSTTTNASDN